MEVEREFAGLALPFAAGVASSVLTAGLHHVHLSISASVSMAIAAICLMALMHPCRRWFSDKTISLLVILTAAFSGMLCGYTSLLAEPGRIRSIPFSFLGDHMAEAIDRIPFRSNEANALVKALITGNRQDITHETIKAFRDSGASHILALSGLHLGIIYSLVSKALGIIGNSPVAGRIRSSTIVILCGIYTLATGAGDSIVRAFLFIILREAAKLSGRSCDTGTLFFSALVVQLCVDPQSFRSVGFQLSYAAMAGIAFIYPWIKGLWPQTSGKRDIIRWVWDSAALSISCQLTTGPIAYMYFRTFPTHFLLTNLIALPLTGILIPSALLTLCLNMLGICPEILLRATETLVTVLTEALCIIAEM